MVVLCAVAVACGPSAVGSSPPTRDAPSTPSSLPSSGPASTPPASSTGGVAVDPALRELLPASVEGLAVMPSPESDAVAAADPAVVANADGVVTGLVVDPGSQAFAYATVVRLRQDVFDDALFRSWRDTFNAGACERAGGISGNAEAAIAGHRTYIGSCAGGIRTHHVWLPSRRVLVSVSSTTNGRLGEAVIEGLVP
jgi:hypothetical protein